MLQGIGFIVCIISSLFYVFYRFSFSEENSRIFNDYKLMSFGENKVIVEEERNIDDLFQKIKIESLEQFQKATCIEGIEFKETKRMVINSLEYAIPKTVKKKIESDLQEHRKHDEEKKGEEEEHFMHNITKTKNGKTHLFMMWWNVKYNKRDKYQICLVIFGFTFEMAPRFMGTSKKKVTKVIGDQPCHCGIWCDRCPILSEEYIEEPIYQQINLSLEQYERMNEWILKKMKKTTFELTKNEITEEKVKLLPN